MCEYMIAKGCSISSLHLETVLCENSNHIFIVKLSVRSLPSLLIILEKQDLLLKGPGTYNV